MSPSGQSNLLLIRRLLHPSILDFDPIRCRFFAQVLLKFWVVRSIASALIQRASLMSSEPEPAGSENTKPRLRSTWSSPRTSGNIGAAVALRADGFRGASCCAPIGRDETALRIQQHGVDGMCSKIEFLSCALQKTDSALPDQLPPFK